VKKIFRHNLQGKCASAPPGHEVHPSQSKSQFLGQFLLGGLDLEAYLDRRRLKKGRQLFGEKCTPRQNPGYAYECRRGLAMRKVSVCLFFRLSVCQTREL